MSESWGGDAIPRDPGGLASLLAGAQDLPAEAIDAAVRAPGRIAEPVLAAMARIASGEPSTERDRNLVFWGLHALAQVSERRVFGPLLRLLRLPTEPLLDVLAEAIDSTLPRILIATFDGDADALEAGILDPSIDELARYGLFGALAYLTFAGRIDRGRTEAILVRFDADRAARAGDMAWAGWESAIALGGFGGLRARVEAARRDARLLVEDEEGDGSDWFDLTLADAEARPADPARFVDLDLGPLEDAVAELEAALASDEDGEAPAPLVNPNRNVGRNDPCPCGSGLKYKKCCLGRDAAA